MFKTVLFPVDQSREVREAVPMVVEIIKIHQGQLHLLSVIEDNPTEEENDGGVMTVKENVDKLLEGYHDLFSKEGVEAQTIEKKGMPAFTICDVADEINANLIVMGCRGLGLTSEGVKESVTNRVINLAPCPVLIIP